MDQTDDGSGLTGDLQRGGSVRPVSAQHKTCGKLHLLIANVGHTVENKKVAGMGRGMCVGVGEEGWGGFGKQMVSRVRGGGMYEFVGVEVFACVRVVGNVCMCVCVCVCM